MWPADATSCGHSFESLRVPLIRPGVVALDNGSLFDKAPPPSRRVIWITIAIPSTTRWQVTSHGRWPPPCVGQLDDDGLEQARRLFLEPERTRGRYREYGPVISRPSEALARSGDYSGDDKILDLAIAPEQMYELDQGEISFKLKIRAACFLESETQSHFRVFKKVGQLCDARSAA